MDSCYRGFIGIVGLVIAVALLGFPYEHPTAQAVDKPTAVAAPRADSTQLQIAVNGPTTTPAGMAVFLQLDCTADLVDWKMLPTGANASFFTMTNYNGMTPDGKPILRHVAFFSTTTPGTYYFVIAASTPTQLGHVVHTVTVTGVGPSPQPDPGPSPGPSPDPFPSPTPGKKLVLVIRESGQPSVALAQTLTALRKYATEKGHSLRVEDPQLQTGNGETPAWFRVYLAKLEADKIDPRAQPAILVGSYTADGKQIVSVIAKPLPLKPDEAVAIIKAAGG